MATASKSLTIPNCFKDSFSFEEIIHLQKEIYEGKICFLDLSRIDFIEPYTMLNLLLVGRNHLRNTGEKLGLVKIPLDIHQYLSRMDFFNKGIFILTDPLDEKYFFKRSSFSKRVLEITDIPNKERESVKAITDAITLFRKRAGYILKYWISENIIDFFVTVISELCQNVFEHSLDSGYLAMQTYTAGNEHIFRLVIADSGIGIRESFAWRNDLVYDSSAKLIEMALTTPISSKRKFGYGLCQVNKIMEKVRGSIFIRSGNASVTVVYHRKHSGLSTFLKNDLEAFPGTQISISLTGSREKH